MSGMTDPMQALKLLQQAIDNKIVRFERCKTHPELRVHLDQPGGPTGPLRYTYADIRNGQVVAITMFVVHEPVNGVPCFQLGYAVIESMRSSGLGTATLYNSIDEISKGFKATSLQRFYVEAVVGTDNTHSNKLATKVLSASPASIIDSFSGEPALQYLKLVE